MGIIYNVNVEDRQRKEVILMDMSIAALSVSMSPDKLGQSMGVSALKMELKSDANSVENILPESTGSLDSSVGTLLDVSA